MLTCLLECEVVYAGIEERVYLNGIVIQHYQFVKTKKYNNKIFKK